MIVEFFPNGADAAFTGLLLLQSFLKEIFQEIEFLPAGLIGTDVESEELAFMFKDVGFEHLVEEVGIFGVDVCCSYRVEYRFALVESIVK